MGGAWFFVGLGLVGVVLLIMDRYVPDHAMFPTRVADKEIFEADFAPYRDRFGLIQNNPGGSSGNGLRYTSEYYILKFRYGLFTKEDQTEFSRIVNSCSIQKGLLCRIPGDPGQQGLDDYVAVSTASMIFELFFAEDFKLYGLKNWNVYNNPNPGHFSWRAWFGRFPGLLAHFYYSSNDVPSWFKTASWTLSVLFCALTAKDSQDEWVLSSHLIIAYEWSGSRTWIQDQVCHIWRGKFRKQWGIDGMSKLLEKYFGHKHPLSKYAVDI